LLFTEWSIGPRKSCV